MAEKTIITPHIIAPHIIAPHIIAHRGASGYFCENTASAFKKAHALGFLQVEIDCQLCADGNMVVFHDDDLQRLAGSADVPPQCDLARLQAQDLRFNYEGSGTPDKAERPPEKILSLQEFLQLAEQYDFWTNFEIKPGLGDGIANGKKLAEILNENYKQSIVPCISSFDFGALEACRAALQMPAEYALLYYEWQDDTIEMARQHQVQALHLHVKYCRAEHIATAKEADLKVRVYVVNDKATAERLRQWGADALFSDFPDRL